MVAHPHRRREYAVVLDVVLEHRGVLLAEGVVRLHLYPSQPRSYGKPVATEVLSLGDAVYVAHEAPGIVRQRIVALLELVKFLNYGYRDYQIVVLELAYSFVVVEDNICIQHEYFRLTHI